MNHRANYRGLPFSSPDPRRGFTLVEMLVVIAIIGVLVSMGSAAYFRFIDTQRQSTTETTMRTVYKVLEQQMRFVIETADKEDVPANVVALAGGDNRRARLIWKKLRLKQEFPMTLAEARKPWNAAGSPLTAADLPGKTVYVLALKKAVTGAGDSSACLLLALQQSRGGVRLNPDDLGTAVTDTNADGVKEIVDAWGVPLQFVRWPTTNAAPWNSELQGLAPGATNTNTAAPAARFADPLDPEGLLMPATWYSTAQRTQFESLCHQIRVPGSNPTRAWYVIPVLQSVGRDNTLNSADDLYSFRLRLGAKGTQQ